jgi:cytochrome c-type biogenesis protein
MILELFTWLSNALNQNQAIALSASFVWGILSIILSPCHLASIPLIVGFIDGQGKMSTKRALYLSFLFSLGILLTIAAIGLITGLMGRILGDVGRWGNYFVAAIFLVVGLYLLGIIRLPFLERPAQPGVKKKGALEAFVLGLLFGIALGPCTFAYMAPILAITFNIASTRFLYAVCLLLIYGIGHCSVIVFAGTFTEVIQHYLNWNERSKGSVIIKKICGLLVILAGLYMIFFE